MTLIWKREFKEYRVAQGFVGEGLLHAVCNLTVVVRENENCTHFDEKSGKTFACADVCT